MRLKQQQQQQCMNHCKSRKNQVASCLPLSKLSTRLFIVLLMSLLLLNTLFWLRSFKGRSDENEISKVPDVVTVEPIAKRNEIQVEEEATTEETAVSPSLTITRGIDSKLGLKHRNCPLAYKFGQPKTQIPVSKLSICNRSEWQYRNMDPDGPYSSDSCQCTNYVWSESSKPSSIVDCISSKIMTRNCLYHENRYCVIQNATVVHRGKDDFIMFHAPEHFQFKQIPRFSTNTIHSKTFPTFQRHPLTLPYCSALEKGGGGLSPNYIVPTSSIYEEKGCKKLIERTTFIYDRYAMSTDQRYNLYHSIHGAILPLFASIMDSAPELFDFENMRMRKNRIQIALLKPNTDFDSDHFPEKFLLNLFSDSPITLLKDITEGKTKTCFRRVVVGVSNRMYLPLFLESKSEYSGTKRRYFRMFSSFVRKNIPPLLTDSLVQRYLTPSAIVEPIVYISSRSSGNIIRGRQIINQKDVEDYFSNSGMYKYAKYVHFVDFGAMTPLEQIHALSRPGVVFVSMYGATFTHLLWMNPLGSTAVMLQHESIHDNLYFGIAELVGLRYWRYNIPLDNCEGDSDYMEFDHDTRLTAELTSSEGLNFRMFERLRDRDCRVDLQKLETYINDAIEHAQHTLRC